MEKIKQIYERLMDSESKDIYKARLLYSLTHDYGEICHIVAGTKPAKLVREQIARFPGNPIYLWGTGFWSVHVQRAFPEIHWSGFVDSNPKEKVRNGLCVLSAEEFKEKHRDAVVVITSTAWYEEIYEQLLSYQCESDKIVNVGKAMTELFDEQYFDLPYLTHVQDEVFVDAGCFDGLTVNNFIKWSGGQYQEILSFEPDQKCYEKCSELLNSVDRLRLVDRGLWSSEQTLCFHETGASDSAITEEGEVQIHTARLDDCIGNRKISFIKMDIEGAEKEAILGARHTIESYKPKLAISIYHKPEDIWELPELLLDICPEYRFYLRHYSLRDAETVLYAL